MFTKSQIELAAGRTRTGADYPKFVQELKDIGVRGYEHLVATGITNFLGDGGYQVTMSNPQESLAISERPSHESLKKAIESHQDGQTDYATFCKQAAESGVAVWVANFDRMHVVYYGLYGNEILTEPIPAVMTERVMSGQR
jgi:uncharacterized protein YbcV (DUF1398 family)